MPDAPGDLIHHDCLVYSLLDVEEEWRFRGTGTAGGADTVAVPVGGRFAAASGALLRAAALAGLGLAVLPTFMIAGDLAAGRLRQVLAGAFRGVDLGIYAVFPDVGRAAGRVPKKVRAFIDLLVAHFRSPPWRS
jgi:DNA-binding transcriptional LysR family regulator